MLTMLAFTACSSNTDDAVNAPQLWHVTLTASMNDETTRALSEGEGNAIIASFAENDEVVVVDADGSTIVGILKAQTAGASTTLSGTLNASTLAADEVVTLRYRSATANYDGQVGTQAGIAANQDYAEGTLTVKTTSPLEFTSSHASLAAKQSITKFSFTDGTNAVNVKTFGIAATGLVQSIAADATSTETIGAVTGTLSTPSSAVYVALRNNAGKQAYSFTVKDEAGNWYNGTKNANLTNGKNYTANVTLTKLADLTSSSAVGTIGVVGGLPAIVISGKKAVALMNAGALCPEAYGTYYTYDNRETGLSGKWYVPTKDELDALATITNTWGTQHGVNGRTFTIGDKTLFLPAAGLDDGDNNPQDFRFVSTDGYYWSNTDIDKDLAYTLNFDSGVCRTISWYKVDALPVRPFYDLSAE